MSEAPEDHLADLLADSFTGRLTEARRQELWDWGQSNPTVLRLIKDFQDPDYVKRELELWKRIDPQKAYRRWRRRQRLQQMKGYAPLAVPLLIGALAWWLLKSNMQEKNSGLPAINSLALVTKSFEEKPLSIDGNNDSIQAHVLPDGTKVWLNSNSKLFYPARFLGSERVVDLKGEAFFESSAGQKPFIVNAGGARIEVLGTRFNVVDYEGDSVEVTLTDGKIKILKGEDSVVLKPGQQVMAAPNSTELSTPRELNGMKVVWWKDKFFYFPPHSNVYSVLQRIARLYDLKVEFHGDIPNRLEYKGKMQRSLKLEEVLQLFRFQGINVTHVGCRLIVEPKNAD